MPDSPNIPKKNSVQGGLLLLSASFIWGFAFIPTRHLGQAGYGIFFEILVRFFSPILLLLPFFWRSIFSAPKKDILNSMLAGMVLFTGIVLTVRGLRLVTYGTVGVFLLSLYTLFVPLYFAFISKKTPSSPALWACALALPGSYLLALGNPGSPPNLGTLLCFAASAFYAAYIIFVSYKAQNIAPHRFQFYQCLGILIIALPVFVIFEAPSLPRVPLTLPLWGSVFFLGALGGTLAYQLFFYGQLKAEPTAAAIILSMQSVFGALAEWLIFGVSLGGSALAGGGMIFAATLIISWPRSRNS